MDEITVFNCDILDKNKLKEIMSNVQPDILFHLAAQSKVHRSWEEAENTLRVNVLGTLCLLEAIRDLRINPTLIVASAAAVYGGSSTPVGEDKEFRPASPYAVSKVAADYLAGLYGQAYGLRIIRIRPFNITGPGMVGDACSDFAKSIVEIEQGRRKALRVGDLDSVRDITDVRDAVEALWLIAEKGMPGDVYNLCSGSGYRIGDLLSKLINMSSVKVNIDQETVRRIVSEDRVQIGDNSKLRDLGWRPRITIDKTLLDILEHYRGIYRGRALESSG